MHIETKGFLSVSTGVCDVSQKPLFGEKSFNSIQFLDC